MNTFQTYNKDYPSVTAVINMLRKESLEDWFKRNTPEFIEAECTAGLKVGKIIHQAIAAQIEAERFSFVTEFPEQARNALDSFDLFRKEHREVKLKKAEIKMISDEYKVNATLDCLAKIQMPIVFDWKTVKAYSAEKPAIYEESIHQASAYVKIYNSWRKIEGKADAVRQAAVVAIAKDKVAYNYLLLTEKAINESFHDVFLPAVRIWFYKKRNGYLERRKHYDKKEYSTEKETDSFNNNGSNRKGQGPGGNTEKGRGHSKKGAKLPCNF